MGKGQVVLITKLIIIGLVHGLVITIITTGHVKKHVREVGPGTTEQVPIS